MYFMYFNTLTVNGKPQLRHYCPGMYMLLQNLPEDDQKLPKHVEDNSHAPRKDVSVNDGPNIRRCSHTIVIL